MERTIAKISKDNYPQVPLTFANERVMPQNLTLFSEKSFGKNEIENIDVSISEPVIVSVAKWFLHRESMSDKKVQKLCFYAYAWYIVFFNDAETINNECIRTLCEDKFEAWVHGPVCRRLYSKFKDYGWSDIPKVEIEIQFDSNVNDLLDQVWNAYGKFSADELEYLTHNEDPWKKARGNLSVGAACSNIINDRDIFDYYSEQQE